MVYFWLTMKIASSGRARTRLAVVLKRCCFFVPLFLVGCDTLSGGGASSDYVETPSVEDFANKQISFKISGEQDSVADSIVAALSNRTVFHRTEVRSPDTYIITAYLPEPEATDARRVRRTAYRFQVDRSSGNPPCTAVAVTWLTKSRGLREESWSIQASDASYTPGSWPDIQTLLAHNRCTR
jgi:hypothetical protein